MASLLHCLFRHCFEHQERDPRRSIDDDGEILNDDYTRGNGEERIANELIHTMGTVHSNSRVHDTSNASRERRQSTQRGDVIYYMRAPGGQQQGRVSEVSGGDYGTRTGPPNDLNRSVEIARSDNTYHGPLFGGLFQFLQQNGLRSSRRGSAAAPSTTRAAGYSSDTKRQEEDPSQASTCTKEVESLSFCGKPNQPDWYPSINSNEIVLPGSEAQRAIAKQMQLELQYNDAQLEDECVICMDGFTYENPRMPTLCGCGENKTYFHLPCLYQWIEQSRKCPSCRERLVWEEL